MQKPCEIPIEEVVMHLQNDAQLSPEARALALDRVLHASEEKQTKQ